EVRVYGLLGEAAAEVLVRGALVAQLALCDAEPAQQVRIVGRLLERAREHVRHLIPAALVPERERLVEDPFDIRHAPFPLPRRPPLRRRTWRAGPRARARASSGASPGRCPARPCGTRARRSPRRRRRAPTAKRSARAPGARNARACGTAWSGRRSRRARPARAPRCAGSARPPPRSP